jgi:cell division protein ZapA
MTKHDEVAKVEIYGQYYNIRGTDDGGYITELAEYVDMKMKEIADQTPTIDSLKVAILAALNITDQYFQLREQLQNRDEKVLQETKKLIAICDTIKM